MEQGVLARLQNETGYISYNFKYQYPGLAILLSFLLGLGAFLGVTGNILTIIAVFKTKELNFGGNMFVINLAFADLCISGIISPMNIVGVVVGEEFFLKRFFLCKILASICLICCCASLMNIWIVSMNRYTYICKNSYYYKFFSKKKCSLLCFLIWVISFGLQMPNYFGWSGQLYDRKTLSCSWDRIKDRSFTIFFAGFLVASPICLTALFYVLIFWHWHQAAKKISNLSKDSGKKSMQLVRMLFLIFFTFVLCWAPYSGIVVGDKDDLVPTTAHAVLIILAHFNSSLNAILYGFVNSQFRNAYFKLLGITYLMKKYGKPKVQNVKENTETMVL